MANMVFESHMFKRWKQRVESNGNVIKNIEVLGIISRDQVNLRGAFLDCILVTHVWGGISKMSPIKHGLLELAVIIREFIVWR